MNQHIPSEMCGPAPVAFLRRNGVGGGGQRKRGSRSKRTEQEQERFSLSLSLSLSLLKNGPHSVGNNEVENGGVSGVGISTSEFWS